MTNHVLTIAVASDFHAYDGDDGPAPSYLKVSAPEDPAHQHPIASLLKLIRGKPSPLTANLLLSPGDLGDKASPAGIRYTWDKIHEIGDALGVTSVIAASGNHDLDSRFKHNKYDARGYLQTLRPGYPVDDIAEQNQYWARNFLIVDGDDYRLLLLNSAAYHGYANEEKNHGRISEVTIEAIKSDLSDRDEKPINICLTHHHPHQHTDIELEDPEVMMGGPRLIDVFGCGEYGQWLIIHGHRHHPRLVYAAGSVVPPVVFSAGSFSAILYPALQTRAKNQFYIIQFDLDDVATQGLVGEIYAWDWTSGLGWEPAAGILSGLPHKSGFGCRIDPKALAKKVGYALQRDFVPWKEMLKNIEELRYITPGSFNVLKKELDIQFGIEILMSGDGVPVQVGKKL